MEGPACAKVQRARWGAACGQRAVGRRVRGEARSTGLIRKEVGRRRTSPRCWGAREHCLPDCPRRWKAGAGWRTVG